MFFKKIIITMTCAFMGNAIAGTMGPVCTPDNVTVPCVNTGWDVGLSAIYLRPAYSAEGTTFFIYGGERDINGTTFFQQLKTDWDWGFKLEGSYHFSTGNDINVNWSHWDQEKIFRFIRPSLDKSNLLALRQHVTPRWDAVNVEFGQHVDFGLRKNIRFHGGLQFARLRHTIYAPFLRLIASEQAPTGYNLLKLRYSGVGPRIGMDLSYDIANNLAVYSNGAAVLLIGNNKGVDASDSSPNRAHYSSVVPELELKLGAKYAYPTVRGTFSLDGGYMWINYFNAFHLAQKEIRGQTSFALHGPYAGIKWVGNV